MKLLVTAGPTREPIDAVRFISNRSSGKMGYAVASAALRHHHSVVLVSGPVSFEPPPGVVLLKVMTAAEMLTAVSENINSCDVLVMAAAVADWRVISSVKKKLKKRHMPPFLALEKTPDILMTLAPKKGNKIFIGFAAETGKVQTEALRKLREKHLDLIVANDVSKPDAGFEVDTNRVTFVFDTGKFEVLPLMTKAEVAERIIAWIEEKFSKRE